MSEEQNHYEMQPMSDEHVEVDGVYRNEWGREEKLKRGETFPADPQMGTSEWQLVELDFENHHNGETDPRLVPKDDSLGNDAGGHERSHSPHKIRHRQASKK
ncbi:transposase [Paenibacillus methanolicus]|uniref:Uncharacterized protein n=1 Tax=Paenibacillus methanolicus TaxID=582686 RepID=A0A5S5BUP6_9BACL|nr:transposase [Paenibacillus methanolicus]TYP70694.1 hypothetical protein BCM02_111200 [Paenibacillus methanolicus]